MTYEEEIDRDFNDWREKYPFYASTHDPSTHELKSAFLDAYARGHACAAKSALLSIARSLAPSAYENTNAEWKEAGPTSNA